MDSKSVFLDRTCSQQYGFLETYVLPSPISATLQSPTTLEHHQSLDEPVPSATRIGFETPSGTARVTISRVSATSSSDARSSLPTPSDQYVSSPSPGSFDGYFHFPQPCFAISSAPPFTLHSERVARLVSWYVRRSNLLQASPLISMLFVSDLSPASHPVLIRYSGHAR